MLIVFILRLCPGYGVKLHSGGGGVGGLGGLGVQSVIPQLPTDPSSMMRTTSSSSSATSSPHGHLTVTPSSSSGPTMSLPQISDHTDTPPSSTSLLTQMNQLGPSERCTPSQAVSMGQQLLAIIAQHERSKMPLPSECWWRAHAVRGHVYDRGEDGLLL